MFSSYHTHWWTQCVCPEIVFGELADASTLLLKNMVGILQGCLTDWHFTAIWCLTQTCLLTFFFRRTTLMRSWLSKWMNTVIVFLFLLVRNAALHPLRENSPSCNRAGWLGVKRQVTPWGQSSACSSALVLCGNKIQAHKRFKGKQFIWKTTICKFLG